MFETEQVVGDSSSIGGEDIPFLCLSCHQTCNYYQEQQPWRGCPGMGKTIMALEVGPCKIHDIVEIARSVYFSFHEARDDFFLILARSIVSF